MLVGAVATIVMTFFLIVQVGHPHTGYYSNVLVVVLLATAIGCAYAPWMANYTEQVEAHNPALSASGLAVWGWILRLVVAVSFLVLPRVITTSTTLVDNQGAATTLASHPGGRALCTLHDGVRLEERSRHRSRRTAGDRNSRDLRPWPRSSPRATGHAQPAAAVAAAGGLSNPQVQGLLAYNPLAVAIEKGQPVSDAEIAAKVGTHSQNLAGLLLAEKKLVPAQKASPNEWKRWWWVCLVGQVVFGILVFTMRGRWSPRAAKRDFDDHERVVSAELAKLIPRGVATGREDDARPMAPLAVGSEITRPGAPLTRPKEPPHPLATIPRPRRPPCRSEMTGRREGEAAPPMKELIYPRFLLPRAERFADKVGFVDVTRCGRSLLAEHSPPMSIGSCASPRLCAVSWGWLGTTATQSWP